MKQVAFSPGLLQENFGHERWALLGRWKERGESYLCNSPMWMLFVSKKTKVVFPVALNCFGSDINKTRKGHSYITEIGMARWENYSSNITLVF